VHQTTISGGITGARRRPLRWEELGRPDGLESFVPVFPALKRWARVGSPLRAWKLKESRASQRWTLLAEEQDQRQRARASALHSTHTY